MSKKLLCLESGSTLTAGKEYEVISRCSGYVTVIDDFGSERTFSEYRFDIEKGDCEEDDENE